MADFILLVLAALVIGAIGFCLVAFTIGRDPGLADPEPDGVATELPEDSPVTADDLAHARFDVAIRGYRMAQVDRVLGASTTTIRALERRVGELEAELAAGRREPGSAEPSGAEPGSAEPGSAESGAAESAELA